jgi:PAS domain S-box-containing protein
VKVEGEQLDRSMEDLFEDAPCGYLSTALDGTILRVNRTFERWTGLAREELIGKRRFAQLLAPGGRIYHETHYAPLLQMQGEAREIAMEIVAADGSRLPALVNSVVIAGPDGEPAEIRTTVFEAGERRRYEEELLRARRRERETAQLLQRSLLAGEIPQRQGLSIGARHRPAETDFEVGGDWWDAFWLTPRRLGLAVGDVVGRGIEAAATMGQLRSAIRALALTDLPPGPLLERLDLYSGRHGVGGMATVVYADLDLDSRRLRFACAGHPPPALISGDGDPRYLWEGRSTPLLVRLGDEPRAESSCLLAPDSLLLFYTDGVVERRSRPIDEGMEHLLREVAVHREEQPETLVTSLLHAVETSGHRDDACLLATRLD